MLLTIVDVVSCENPDCRQFARIVSVTRSARSYYCPTCGSISRPRPVDAELAASQERYAAYLQSSVEFDAEPAYASSR